MKVDYTHPRVITALAEAPDSVRKAFFKQIRLLSENLRHPSLRAKKYDEAGDIWQARDSRDWRFYFTIAGDTCIILEIIPPSEKDFPRSTKVKRRRTERHHFSVDGPIAELMNQSAIPEWDDNWRYSSIHSLEPATATEIAFLAYRLDVLSQWPDSDHRSAVIAATVGRIRNLVTAA